MKLSLAAMRLAIIIIVLTATATTKMALGGGVSADRSPDAVEKWLRKMPINTKQKLTKLRFYCHENFYGKNPTAVPVAKAHINITSNSRTLFGLVMAVDNLLTVGPEPDSKTVGFARGIYASASRQEEALLTTIDLVFTDGEYKGGTLSVFGRNPIFRQYRELPIIGGSGVFRLARGSATAETYTFDATTGDPVIEFHLIVLHY